MTLLTRSTLKNLFTRGAVPSEVNFSDFIDSTINKVDDGFSQSPDHGFMLAPQGANRKLLSFFESIRDSNAAFSLSLNPSRHSKGLSIDDAQHKSVLFLRDSGNIGIGTTTPNYKLEVNGMAGMDGRVGTFASGTVKANGEWQTIVDRLEDISAFEVIAQAGAREGRGRYAFTHAFCFSNFGSGKIEQTRTTFRKAPWHRVFDRVSLRWIEGEDGYQLQVRTFQNYGYLDDNDDKPALIRYYVSKLWDHSMTKS
jgi:hypothetical protein